ncbi:MAG: hypothetical protein JNK48_20185 [Bryobacterales bacterium]|nr:hypothetical protein [Bryobacterales bacterium]
MSQLLAVFCACLILWPQAAFGQTTPAAKPSLKEQVILMAAGSVVEVHLTGKQKIRGRLGEISDDGFDVQHLENQKMVTKSIRFDQVRKVRLMNQGMSTAAKVTLGALAGIGGFFLVMLAIVAAGGWD